MKNKKLVKSSEKKQKSESVPPKNDAVTPTKQQSEIPALNNPKKDESNKPRVSKDVSPIVNKKVSFMEMSLSLRTESKTLGASTNLKPLSKCGSLKFLPNFGNIIERKSSLISADNENEYNSLMKKDLKTNEEIKKEERKTLLNESKLYNNKNV